MKKTLKHYKNIILKNFKNIYFSYRNALEASILCNRSSVTQNRCFKSISKMAAKCFSSLQ